jgi:hypothetical protein
MSQQTCENEDCDGDTFKVERFNGSRDETVQLTCQTCGNEQYMYFYKS